MNHFFCNLLCFLIVGAVSPAFTQHDIASPEQFLGYPLGTQFTYHHKVVDYFDYVAKASIHVKLEEYGTTFERRPLVTAIISSAANIKNIERLRKNNLIVTGLLQGKIEGDLKPIIWLSYNIHGDEAAGTEAALKTLHHLASDKNAKRWLDDVIIIIDPCENPDGRDRYANWYNRVVNRMPNTDMNSVEHHQDWPGGRYNHYLFDLNRDWAWQTQVESASRSKLYHKWMPHIHADLHEMGVNSPYFFAPAVAPYHETITKWQRDFQQLVGNNNAKYFDPNGWLYYTDEVFDLLYPSYGDTWPIFNGAIGFTYEQGGSGQAGLSATMETGNKLGLKDRLEHHFAASISTIETGYNNKVQLLKEFKNYFSKKVEDKYKTFVIKNIPKKSQTIAALLKLLDNQSIQYGFPKEAVTGTISGFDYLNNKKGNCSIASNDIIVRLDQPLSRFVKVLFEPKTMLEDSLTYDLTAWAIPYIYELETYALERDISIKKYDIKETIPTQLPNRVPYAVVLTYNDATDVKILGELLQQNIVVRFAERSFKVNDQTFDRGSLIITKGDNQTKFVQRYDEEIIKIANRYSKPLTFLNTGMTQKGYDLGSNYHKYIKPVKVALIGGKGINPMAYGEVWYYLEQTIGYPVTTLSTDYLSSINLSQYDVIIMPTGSYGSHTKKLMSFVKKGGKIIALDGAATALARQSSTNFERQKTPKQDQTGIKYAERERASTSRLVAGSIYKIYLDETHPLSFGFSNGIHIMKRNSTVFKTLDENGWTVGRFTKNSHISGFVGMDLKEDLKNSAALAVENYGQGHIIYMPDSPIFRGFWHSGKVLFGNALFFVGQ